MLIDGSFDSLESQELAGFFKQAHQLFSSVGINQLISATGIQMIQLLGKFLHCGFKLQLLIVKPLALIEKAAEYLIESFDIIY